MSTVATISFTVWINREPPGGRKKTDIVIKMPSFPETFNVEAKSLRSGELDREWRAIAELKQWLRAGLPAITSKWRAETRAVFKHLNARMDSLLGEMEYRESLPEWKQRALHATGRPESAEPSEATYLPPPRETKFSLRDLTAD